jgi:HAD superfamily hydrolase (TIGR01484 family)
MTYQLIAVDMDGTLLGKDGRVSDKTMDSIRTALLAGKKVILATGRPIYNARPTAELLGLELPMIINNGSEVWRTPTTLHARHLIKPEYIARIYEYIQKYGDLIRFWSHTIAGPFNAGNLPERFDSQEWLQFSIKSEEPEILEDYRREIQSWGCLELSNSHPMNAECNPLGISKASGLQSVCDLLGIPLSQAIAIGDSLNDIPMIRAAGLGVAMGNAQEAVKEAAELIAPANYDDGVAHIIDNYLLGSS